LNLAKEVRKLLEEEKPNPKPHIKNIVTHKHNTTTISTNETYTTKTVTVTKSSSSHYTNGRQTFTLKDTPLLEGDFYDFEDEQDFELPIIAKNYLLAGKIMTIINEKCKRRTCISS